MATNLLFSFPDIPDDTLTIDWTDEPQGEFQFANLFSGHRKNRARLGTASTSATWTFDLGTGNTSTADHIIIAGANALTNTTDIDIDRSSDGSTWTNEYADSSFSSATLRGPGSQDYAEKFTESSAYRYWRVTLSGTSDVMLHSKMYFGKLFDIGKDPENFSFAYETNQTSFIAADGTRYTSSNIEKKIKIDLAWRGVSNDNTESFVDKISSKRKRYCFLYADTDTRILAGHKILHCEVEQDSIEVEKVFDDYNLISASFIQMVS